MPESRRAGRRARRAAAYGEQPPGFLAWWHRRTQRRIVGRGGHIAGATLPKPMPFTPTPLDEAVQTAWVVEQAAGLVPGAVDESLGHALDNAINARADQWIGRLQSEFAQHMSGLRLHRAQADSAIAQEMRLQPPDTHRAIETEEARNAAAARLRGEHEKAAWTDPGHADPTLLAGHSAGRYIYLLALAIAAGADIAAFYQVIELVLPTLTPGLVAVLVVGFTGTALALAHFIGIMLRDRRAGAKWIQTFMIIVATVIWLALGALAFWIRLDSRTSAAASGFSASVTGSAAPAETGSSLQSTVPGAAMFGGLYAATGAVAMLGGYLTHNPLRASFRQAQREHRAAAEGHAISARRLRLAEAEREFFDDQIAAAEKVCHEAELARHALAEELKQRARLELAKRLRDTSATDAFLNSDARPYTYRPFPS